MKNFKILLVAMLTLFRKQWIDLFQAINKKEKKKNIMFPSWHELNQMPVTNGFGFRSKPYLRFGSAAFKTDAPQVEVKELTDETDPENKAAEGDSEEIKAIKKINRQVKQFNAILGTRAKAEDFTTVSEQLAKLQKDITTMQANDISTSIKTINEANEKIWKQIAEMQEETARQKEEEAGTRRKRGQLVSTKEVKDFIDATFKDGKKTNEAAKIELKVFNDEVNKAAENFGIPQFFQGGADTVIDAFTGRFVDPTLYQRRRKRNLILDNFTIGTIGVPKLIFLVKIEDGDDAGSSPGDSGGADWILSSEAKPKRSFRVTTGEAEAKKVAIFGTVEDKLLRDVASLENWIREDFMAEMREKINDGLLNNNPAVNPKAPQGMKNDAVQFTATPAFANKYTATQSNYIDQIIAAIAFMDYNREEAGQVFVSGDVYYAILALKDANRRYQNDNLIYTDVLGRLYIAGVPIIKADKDDIPATHVLITAVDLGFKMLAYGPMVFERGLNGEDFRYDRTSFRGYQEFLSYLPTHRENSVMYDTWANIIAGIEA